MLNPHYVELFVEFEVLQLLIVEHPEVLFGEILLSSTPIPHCPGKKPASNGTHTHILKQINVGFGLVKSNLAAIMEAERKR